MSAEHKPHSVWPGTRSEAAETLRDLLWKIRGGNAAHDDELERGAEWVELLEEQRIGLLEQLEVAQRSASDEKQATERFWTENARLKEQLQAAQKVIDAARALPDFFTTDDGRVHSFVPLLEELSNPASEPEDAS